MELGNQIDDSRSTFIRGGESRFMTYCVKTQGRPPACPEEAHARCSAKQVR